MLLTCRLYLKECYCALNNALITEHFLEKQPPNLLFQRRSIHLCHNGGKVLKLSSTTSAKTNLSETGKNFRFSTVLFFYCALLWPQPYLYCIFHIFLYLNCSCAQLQIVVSLFSNTHTVCLLLYQSSN